MTFRVILAGIFLFASCSQDQTSAPEAFDPVLTIYAADLGPTAAAKIDGQAAQDVREDVRSLADRCTENDKQIVDITLDARAYLHGQGKIDTAPEMLILASACIPRDSTKNSYHEIMSTYLLVREKLQGKEAESMLRMAFYIGWKENLRSGLNGTQGSAEWVRGANKLCDAFNEKDPAKCLADTYATLQFTRGEPLLPAQSPK